MQQKPAKASFSSLPGCSIPFREEEASPGKPIPCGICPDGDEQHVAGAFAHPFPDLAQEQAQVTALP